MSFISEGSQLQISLNFEVITCYKCGVPFAVPGNMKQELMRTQERFYCPSGHPQCYSGETTEQRLRRQLEEKERIISRQEIQKIQLEGQVIKLDRKLKRVHNGVCPCCNRSFVNLQRHMKNKHPEILKDKKP